MGAVRTVPCEGAAAVEQEGKVGVVAVAVQPGASSNDGGKICLVLVRGSVKLGELGVCMLACTDASLPLCMLLLTFNMVKRRLLFLCAPVWHGHSLCKSLVLDHPIFAFDVDIRLLVAYGCFASSMELCSAALDGSYAQARARCLQAYTVTYSLVANILSIYVASASFDTVVW
jgi:hypothetical protein